MGKYILMEMTIEEKIKLIKSWTARFEYNSTICGSMMVSYSMDEDAEDHTQFFVSLERAIDITYNRIYNRVFHTVYRLIQDRP